MAYIVQRRDRFYVVDYDGIDPLTGRERRRWHPAGRDRHEADQVAARLERDAAGCAPRRGTEVGAGHAVRPGQRGRADDQDLVVSCGVEALRDHGHLCVRGRQIGVLVVGGRRLGDLDAQLVQQGQDVAVDERLRRGAAEYAEGPVELARLGR